MAESIYRYQFEHFVEPAEIEGTIVLAIVATEAIHGTLATQTELAHCFDAESRVCIVDASNPVGRDFNSLFLEFTRREFGSSAVRIRRVNDRPSTKTAVAA